MSETTNPGVEGSAEPPAGLVEAVARALGGPMMMRCDGCDGCVWTRCTSCPQPGQPCACSGVPGADPELARIAIAAVRTWDAEQRRRQRLTGPVINVVTAPTATGGRHRGLRTGPRRHDAEDPVSDVTVACDSGDHRCRGWIFGPCGWAECDNLECVAEARCTCPCHPSPRTGVDR